MRSNSAVVDGISMRWEEEGQGTPLVLIHGIPTCPSLWRKVIPRVVGARCLAWEMVGYGESIPEGRGRDISVGRQADYLVSWLRHLAIDRAVFVGHDLGGGVAHIAAIRYPETCAGLLLTNAIGYDSWPIPSVKLMQTLAPVVRHLPDAVFELIFRTFISRGHDRSDDADEAFDMHWPHYVHHGGADAFIREVESLSTTDTLAVADKLSQLNVPARVVWGAGDMFQKVEYGERFARDLRAPLRRIDGARHFTPEDHPDVIAEEINRLLNDVPH